MEEFDAIEYINTPRWRESSYGLDRIELLLDELGNPDWDLKYIHVAGTNGKGSTAAYIASILQAAGNKVGLFTSPYIDRFEERIQVDGQMIPSDRLLEVTLKVKEAADAVEEELEEHPTEFELMCAVAITYFAEEDCDIAVMEVGLGGRLDATNVIDTPEVAAITPISLDHTELLGDTLLEIAQEKGGILKPGGAMVLATQPREVLEYFLKFTRQNHNSIFCVERTHLEVGPIRERDGKFFRRFSYRDVLYETQLLGSYQPSNAATALEIVNMLRHKGWMITDEQAQEGIWNTQWPGRFEVVARDPWIIIDGAHNPQGASALAASLKDFLEMQASDDARVWMVFGVLADKNYLEMLEALGPLASGFFLYEPNNPRALNSGLIKDVIETSAWAAPDLVIEDCETADQALAQACAQAAPRDVIVCCGSLYSIGDIKRQLN